MQDVPTSVMKFGHKSDDLVIEMIDHVICYERSLTALPISDWTFDHMIQDLHNTQNSLKCRSLNIFITI